MRPTLCAVPALLLAACATAPPPPAPPVRVVVAAPAVAWPAECTSPHPPFPDLPDRPVTVREAIADRKRLILRDQQIAAARAACRAAHVTHAARAATE